MEKSSKNLIIISGGLALLIAALVPTIAFVRSSQKSVIDSATIEVDGSESKVLSFDLLDLKPGQSKDFDVKLLSRAGLSFALSLDFNQKKDGGLAEYVNVEISHGDFAKTDYLGELFNSQKPISFVCDFVQSKEQKINFRYSMSSSIGNEAQDKFVDFDIVMNFKKQ